MNNHISTQIKGDLIKVGGPRRAWQGREEGIFNLEECALNKTDKKQRKKIKRKKAHKQLYSYVATLSALQWRGYNLFVTFTFIFPKYCIPRRNTWQVIKLAVILWLYKLSYLQAVDKVGYIWKIILATVTVNNQRKTRLRNSLLISTVKIFYFACIHMYYVYVKLLLSLFYLIKN